MLTVVNDCVPQISTIFYVRAGLAWFDIVASVVLFIGVVVRQSAWPPRYTRALVALLVMLLARALSSFYIYSGLPYLECFNEYYILCYTQAFQRVFTDLAASFLYCGTAFYVFCECEGKPYHETFRERYMWILALVVPLAVSIGCLFDGVYSPKPAHGCFIDVSTPKGALWTSVGYLLVIWSSVTFSVVLCYLSHRKHTSTTRYYELIYQIKWLPVVFLISSIPPSIIIILDLHALESHIALEVASLGFTDLTTVFIAVLFFRRSRFRSFSFLVPNDDGGQLSNRAQIEYELCERAAQYMEDVINSRQIFNLERSSRAAQAYKLVHSTTFSFFRKLVTITLLLITLFEIPSILQPDLSEPYVRQFQFICLLIEQGCVVFLVVDCAAITLVRGRTIFKDFWSLTKVIVTVLLMADAIQALIDACDVVSFTTGCHFFRVLRPFLFVEQRTHLRRQASNVIRTIPRLLDVGVFLLILFVVYVALGMIIFSEDPVDNSFVNTTLDQNFGELNSTVHSLVVLLTTANYPNVMMYWYTRNYFYGVYFVTFLIIGVFFMLNLTLAVVYNSYNDFCQEDREMLDEQTLQGLKAAFDMLSIDRKVSRSRFLGLFKRLMPSLQEARVCQLFDQILDTDRLPMDEAALANPVSDSDAIEVAEGDVSLSFEQFAQLRLVINLQDFNGAFKAYQDRRFSLKRFRETIEPYQIRFSVFMARYFGLCSPVYNSLVSAVTSNFYEYLVDFIIVANVTLILAQVSYNECAPTCADAVPTCPPSAPACSTADLCRDCEIQVKFEIVQRCFLGLYIADVVLKTVSLGLFGYFLHLQNLFDFLVTFVSLLALASSSSSNLNYVLFFRILRLVRIIVSIKRFTLFVVSFFNLLPYFVSMFQLLVMLFYVYSIVGMHMFSAVPHSAFEGTTYAALGYWKNNFQNVARAYCTLFELMVVNNWYVIMDGFVTATNNPWNQLYFGTFYFFSVILILNLLIAYVLDVFIEKWQQSREAALAMEKKEEDQKLLLVDQFLVILGQDLDEEGRSTVSASVNRSRGLGLSDSQIGSRVSVDDWQSDFRPRTLADTLVAGLPERPEPLNTQMLCEVMGWSADEVDEIRGGQPLAAILRNHNIATSV